MQELTPEQIPNRQSCLPTHVPSHRKNYRESIPSLPPSIWQVKCFADGTPPEPALLPDHQSAALLAHRHDQQVAAIGYFSPAIVTICADHVEAWQALFAPADRQVILTLFKLAWLAWSARMIGGSLGCSCNDFTAEALLFCTLIKRHITSGTLSRSFACSVELVPSVS